MIGREKRDRGETRRRKTKRKDLGCEECFKSVEFIFNGRESERVFGMNKISFSQ